MGVIERLASSYKRLISESWEDVAPPKRVIFCVYDNDEERRVRARLEIFKLSTLEADHEWAEFDLTDSFAKWLPKQRYAEKYFEKPEGLGAILPKFIDYLSEEYKAAIASSNAGKNAVMAVIGAGSLFGLLRIKVLVDMLAPLTPGRLLVFFPGSCEGGNYRLLDVFDGWNQHAVPVMADWDY